MSGPCPSRRYVNGETKRLVDKRIAIAVDVLDRGVPHLSALWAWHRLGAEHWSASFFGNLWLALWNATRCGRCGMLVCKTTIAHLLALLACSHSASCGRCLLRVSGSYGESRLSLSCGREERLCTQCRASLVYQCHAFVLSGNSHSQRSLEALGIMAFSALRICFPTFRQLCRCAGNLVRRLRDCIHSGAFGA